MQEYHRGRVRETCGDLILRGTSFESGLKPSGLGERSALRFRWTQRGSCHTGMLLNYGKKMSSDAISKGGRSWVWLVPMISFALLCYRVLPLGPPEIFADEYSYPIWAKHFFDGTALPSFATEINNWIYLRVMSLAFLGHGDVMWRARLINALVAASSAIPVFLIVRRRASVVLAALSAVLYAVFCAGNAAAYFMPEAMFFTAFAFVCLLLLRFIEYPGMERLAVLAVAVGTMSLIKIHVIFLLPAVFFTVFATMGLKRQAWSRGVAYCFALLTIALATNLGWSFLLSPKFTFNILGGFYGGVASDSSQHLNWQALSLSALVAGNHLLVILPLSMVPLTFLCVAAAHAWKKRNVSTGSEFDWAMLGIFTVAALATLLCVTSLFTVSIASGAYAGAYESLSRLHGRYYENILAMALFLGWATVAPLRLRFAIPLALCGLGLIGAGAWYVAHHVWMSPVDFSIAYIPFTGGRRAIAIVVLAGVCSLLALVVQRPWARWIMVVGGVLYLGMNAYATDVLRKGIKPMEEDVIPLPNDAKSPVVVMAHSMDANVYRAAYTLIDRQIAVSISQDPQCDAVPDGATIIVSLQNMGPECGYVPYHSSGRVWVGTRPSHAQ